jgi:SOS-response transcriptional repressor LexA
MGAGGTSQVYEALMRFRPAGLSPNAWAVKAGVSRTVWADMRRHGNPSRRTLEKLLAAAGSSLAEFEALRVDGGPTGDLAAAPGIAEGGAASWGRPQPAPLPLVATAIAGDWGDPMQRIELTHLCRGEMIDRLPRPASLAEDAAAYAITIVGDSMWPRFRPGRRVAVSRRAPVAIGDDVLVTLNAPAGESEQGRERVLVKELVRRSGGGVELRQFNPDVTFHVPARDITAIEKVLGELI